MRSPSEAVAPAGFCCQGRDYRYAGTHLLIEFWDAKELDNLKVIERALTDAVSACGATLLELMLHHFSPYGGVTGVAVIAESHISIHTWPEFEYAAIDIFTCGTVDPHLAVPVLREALTPGRIQLSEHRRGIMV